MRVDRTLQLVPLLFPVIQSALEFWSRRDLVSQGVPLQPLPPTHVLTTDASTYGWGVVCGPLTASGCGRANQSSLHINFSSWRLFFLALKRFQRWLYGTHVLVQMDSTSAMHYLNRAGGTRSRCLDWKVREIIHWYLSMRITLSAAHISGQENVVVRLSRFQIENPRRLERSTEWSLNLRVTNQYTSIFGAYLLHRADAFLLLLTDLTISGTFGVI